MDRFDGIAAAGLVLLNIGAWMAWHPAAFMLTGFALFYYAWVKSKA